MFYNALPRENSRFPHNIPGSAVSISMWAIEDFWARRKHWDHAS